MSWSDKQWMLHQVNSSRKKGEEKVTSANAKETYIPSEIRLRLEKQYGAEKVAEVFGEASHLQKTEMMLLEIEKGELTKEEKYEYLIDISYQITNFCGKLDSENSLWDKYYDLYGYIPIAIKERENEDSWSFSVLDFYKQEVCISVDELKEMKTWLSLAEEVKEEPEKKVFFEYIFELVYISLKEIFKEVKAEIMPKEQRGLF